MSHTSIVVPNSIEFINVEPTKISPLLSKCQIKVCYVGDEPNRNKSVITKQVALEMAPTLRGCPIVGFYNETKTDFEEHNKIIDLSNGKFEITDTTRPYGFVDIGAKVWFQKFTDDGVEHEYLMTEGYIWTGQYPEAQRIIDKGNNQSMELDEKTLDAYWTKDNNGKYKFFIINEAVMSKLCILGEDVEPCFEGAQITKVQFAFDDNFKDTLFSFVNQMKEILNGGETPMYTTYAVEIGGVLWDQLYSYLAKTYPSSSSECCCGDSKYRIEAVCEEGSQKFVILQDRMDSKYYRMNFSLTEVAGLTVDNMLIEVTKTYVPAETPQFSAEAVEEYARKKKEEAENKEEPKAEKEDEDPKSDDKKESKSEDKKEDNEENPKSEDAESEDEDDEEKKKKKADKKEKYSLEDIPEYAELNTQYEELKTKYSNLETANASLNALVEELKANNEKLNEAVESLNNFKLSVERAKKEDMIYNTFCMLDNEYKKDVIENINSYSLDDIEAKLAVICVRNKISLNTEEPKETGATTYSLEDSHEDDYIPAWVKAAKDVEKTMNK